MNYNIHSDIVEALTNLASATADNYNAVANLTQSNEVLVAKVGGTNAQNVVQENKFRTTQAKLDQITAMLSYLQHHNTGLVAHDPIAVPPTATTIMTHAMAMKG
eukprot:12004082-Ditylum_brightwellii.AAC.1